MIKTHKIYYPLYNDNEHFIFLITGGRASGKSFSVGTFIERLTFEYNAEKRIAHQILYSRYTMVSAGMSVIPEFTEKLELDETQQFFHRSNNDIMNTVTKSRVMFRGIRTSSGNQTAKLKSIQGLTVFICDEAEEWVDEESFEKIMLSIRTKGLKNRVIIIMNPCDTNHWVYRRFIKDTHRIEYYDGVPVQISTHPSVCHIHTSYLDNIENLSEEFLKEALSMKQKNPERYAHIFMGRWADVAEGAVFKKWGIVDEFPPYAKLISRAMDFGYSCFSGDTLITTMRGDIPIKDIQIGDYVLTRQGFRRVRNKMYNGVKTAITKEIIVNGTKYRLSATYEHNINANGKWKKYGELTEKDNLFVLSNLTGSNIEDTQVENIPTIISTNGKVKENITQNSCITQFLNTIMGRFHKAALSTIRILTRSITTLTTSLQLHLQSITEYICVKRKGGNSHRNTQNGLALPKRTGVNEEKKLNKALRKKLGSVRIAEKSLRQQMYTKDFVPTSVITDGNIQPKNVIFRWLVNVVEKLLWAINTLSQRRAQKNVRIISRGIEQITTLEEKKCDVYDLEIEGVHEYFANGILVHNCDPTAIVRCGVVDNRLYIDELCYRTGMTSGDIIRELRQEAANGDDGFVYSESADPRLIDEIGMGGVIIYPVAKGAGSIEAGLSKMLDMEIFVTKRSLNLQNELRNYVWAKDKDGKYVSIPEDHDQHCIDAARYFVLHKIMGFPLVKKKVTKEQLGVY